MMDLDHVPLFADALSDEWKTHFIALEPRVTYQLALHLRRCCEGGHFLDVGANFGWYTLLAAALGCHLLEAVTFGASKSNLKTF